MDTYHVLENYSSPCAVLVSLVEDSADPLFGFGVVISLPRPTYGRKPIVGCRSRFRTKDEAMASYERTVAFWRTSDFETVYRSNAKAVTA